MAGVCGQLQLSNFRFLRGGFSPSFLFDLSTSFIVGYQLYEYHFNQILGKREKYSEIESYYLQKLKRVMVLCLVFQELSHYSKRKYCVMSKWNSEQLRHWRFQQIEGPLHSVIC